MRRVARRAADRYLGGETLEEALASVGRLHAEGLRASIDFFGEAVTEPAPVERVVNEYKRLNRALDRFDPRVNVWADLSNLGLDISDGACREAVQTIVETLPIRIQRRARRRPPSRQLQTAEPDRSSQPHDLRASRTAQPLDATTTRMVGMVSAMPEPTETAGENTSALYSVFCGILSIPSAFLFGFGAMFGVAGIVLGWLGLRRADTGEGRRGMAIAGLVLSGLGVLLAILIVASA